MKTKGHGMKKRLLRKDADAWRVPERFHRNGKITVFFICPPECNPADRQIF